MTFRLWAVSLLFVLVAAGNAPADELRPLPASAKDAAGVPFAGASSIRYSQPEDVFYVADTGNRRVVLLRGDLTPLGAISLAASGVTPYCALPVGEGSVWVSDGEGNAIYLFEASGACAETLRVGAGRAAGRMTWNAQGRIVAIDRRGHALLFLDPTPGGALPDTLRVPGDGPLEDVAVSPEGEIVVVASSGKPFWSWSPDRPSWLSWGSPGEGPTGGGAAPCGISFNLKGALWVVDPGRNEVGLLEAGRWSAGLSGADRSAPGAVQSPAGVAVRLEDGTAAVIDRGRGLVLRFVERESGGD